LDKIVFRPNLYLAIFRYDVVRNHLIVKTIMTSYQVKRYYILTCLDTILECDNRWMNSTVCVIKMMYEMPTGNM